MPEEVLFEDERLLDRAEIADYLRSVADKLDAGDPITFSAAESVTVTPPARPEFEVKVERETPHGGGPGELSIELEIEWNEDGERAGDEGLTIG